MSDEIKNFFSTYTEFVTKVTSDPSLDLDALIRASNVATEIVGHDTPACVSKGGSLAAIRQKLSATP